MYLILTDDKELVGIAKNRSIFIGDINNIETAKTLNRTVELENQVEMSKNQVCTTDTSITKMMRDLGIPPHIKGYLFLRHVYSAFCKDSLYIEGGYTKLYDKICKEIGNTTPSRVERAIRHAIGTTSEKNPETINKIFGKTLSKHKQTPENSMFISTTCRLLVENYL